MRTAILILAWYSVMAIGLSIVVAPITVGAVTTQGDVMLGTLVSLPVLALATLVLVYLFKHGRG